MRSQPNHEKASSPLTAGEKEEVARVGTWQKTIGLHPLCNLEPQQPMLSWGWEPGH